MHILGRLTVLPDIPPSLARLRELAHNLHWTWSPAARALFRSLDPDLWERCGHNPVTLLRDVPQARLDEAAEDEAFLARLAEVTAAFDAVREGARWFDEAVGASDDLYAYFCAEYGWHEALPLYSGGLGVLAGDHTKAASDLGVPLLAVGLWYPEGYFHQRIASDGSQKAEYVRLDPHDLPFERVTDADGEPVRVQVEAFGAAIEVRALQTHVGRVRVVLLDVDHEGNDGLQRDLLKRLYGGDQRTRVAQEIVLGIGGVRMLRALDLQPSTWHMNEGHSAFLALERCRERVEAGLPLDAARESVRADTVFTVHTPVAAGNDAFAFDLLEEAFGDFAEHLGLEQQAFFQMGRADHGWGAVFSMPALALRFSSARNGVAALHGDTSRRIWNDLWPEVPPEEVPIGHVTNGVHAATWLAPEIAELLDEALPTGLEAALDDPAAWEALADLDPAALWGARRSVKARVVRFLRRHLLRQLNRQEASPTAKRDSGELFDPDVLTIGFARRFATYKRATLVFHDLERLERLLTDPHRPVQLVFAGKAHPADEAGQALIRHIDELAKDPRFTGRILFVEDYDIEVGRALTRGVDVWLNTPRRPLEASGTSGQKAAMNGVLNLSISDGWWDEGYTGDNGWTIGNGAAYEDEARADAADADSLYDLLEREVIPLYYQRDAAGVPLGWMERATRAIATVAPRFNARRMVKDYVRDAYAPASERGRQLARDGFARARALATWRAHIGEHWPDVTLEADALGAAPRTAGEEVTLEARLNAPGLEDVDLCVEVVYGPEREGEFAELQRVPMEETTNGAADGARRFAVTFRPKTSGRLAYGVRAYPLHPDLPDRFDAHAVRWA